MRKSSEAEAAAATAGSASLEHVRFFSRVTAMIPPALRQSVGDAAAGPGAAGAARQGKKKGKAATAAAGIEELRAKLHAKIAAVAPKRKADSVRGERERKKPRREERQQPRPDRKGNLRKGDPAEKARAKEERAAAKKARKEEKKQRKQMEKGADMVFGRLENKAESARPDYRDMVHKKVDKHKMLKKAEAFERKLKAMPEEEAKRVVHEKAVSSALLRAQGIAVKDNPAMLKKAIKRDERSKAKSARQWADRKKTADGTFKAAGSAPAGKKGVSSNQRKRDRKKAKAASKAASDK